MNKAGKMLMGLVGAMSLSAAGLFVGGCAGEKPMDLAPAQQTEIDRADPQMRAVLNAYHDLGPKPVVQLTPAQARQQPTIGDAANKVMADRHIAGPEEVGGIENRTVPGPAGQIAVRVYKPLGAGPFPGLVYFHGGGWVLGNLDTYDASCRTLSNKAHCVVISVDYRLAPENKFPAADEDAYAATQYVISHPSEFMVDGRHIAVGGESAGGNLATVVCLMSRDRGAPMPCYQLLVYPVANYGFDSKSYMENEDAVPLDRASMMWFFGNYLPSAGDGANSYVSTVNADLSKLPPATLITAQIDPLRSDGEMLRDKLSAAGVPVQYKCYDGVTHEFFGLGAVVDTAKQAERFAAEGLNSAYAK